MPNLYVNGHSCRDLSLRPRIAGHKEIKITFTLTPFLTLLQLNLSLHRNLYREQKLETKFNLNADRKKCFNKTIHRAFHLNSITNMPNLYVNGHSCRDLSLRPRIAGHKEIKITFTLTPFLTLLQLNLSLHRNLYREQKLETKFTLNADRKKCFNKPLGHFSLFDTLH